MTATTPESHPYEAFISYNHDDAYVARLLHRRLEDFHQEAFSRQPRFRVLRDETHLTSGPDLQRAIDARLALVDWLILIASPSAASSTAIDLELRSWRRRDPDFEHLLIVQVGGDLEWDREAGTWDPTRTTAAPPALELTREPLFKDLRAVATDRSLDAEQRKLLDGAAFDIVCRVRGIEKDEMQAEHDRVRRRQLLVWRAAWVIAVLLAAAGLLLAVTAWNERSAADHQTMVATSRLLVQRAGTEPDAELAVSDALAARAINDDADTRSALVDRVLGNRFVARLPGRDIDPRPETVTRAGNLLLREGPAHSLVAIDLSNPAAPGPPMASASAACPSRPPSDGVPAGPCGTIETLAVTPDGRTAASGGDDHQVVLWDLSRGGPPRALGPALAGAAPDPGLPARLGAADPGPRLGEITALAFSPDGRRLAAGGRDQTVSVWDVARPDRPVLVSRLALPGTGLEVLGLAYAPDGRTLAVGSRTISTNNVQAAVSVRLWDVSDPAGPLGPLTVDDRPVDLVEPLPVSFTPDGRFLLSAQHGRPRAWDLAAPGSGPIEPPVTDGTHATAVIALAVAPDGQTVATGGFDAQVRLWRLRPDGRFTRASEPLVGQRAAVTGVVFTSDSQSLATGGHDGALLVWSAGDSPRATLTAEVPARQGGGQSLAISDDGQRAATGGRLKSVVVWDVRGALPVRGPEVYAGREGDFRLPEIRQRGVVAAFSPDGQRLATGSSDGALRFFDIGPDGGLTPRGPAILGPVALSALAYTADGDAVLVGDDVGTVTAVTGLNGPVPVVRAPRAIAQSPVSDLRRSPDGRTFVAAISGTEERSGSFAQRVTLDPNGSIGPLGAPLIGHSSGLTAAAFSRNGRTLLTGSVDRSLRWWDLEPPAASRPAARPIGRPQFGHAEAVTGLAIAPDGTTAATSGADAVVRLWDLSDPSTLRPLGPPVGGSPAGLPAVGFTADGRLLSLGLDDVLRLYDLRTLQAVRHDPVPLACTVTDGGMSAGDWNDAGLGVDFRSSCPRP